MRHSSLLGKFWAVGLMLLAVLLLGGAFSVAEAQQAVEGVATQGSPLDPPATTSGLIMRYIALLPLVFVFFYLLVIQPEKQKLKRQQELLSSVAKGDALVTSSGLIGKFSGVEGNCVLLDVGNGTRLKFEASAIVKKFEQGAQGDSNGKSKAA